MKKKSLLPLLLLGAAGVLYARGQRKATSDSPDGAPAARNELSSQFPSRGVSQNNPLSPGESHTATAMRHYTMYFLLPVWLVPGFLDYLWHRDTRIETTSGTLESVIHALMMTQVGMSLFAGLLLEINAGVIAFLLANSLLHEATAFWDVGFAVKRRAVFPHEQHTHSALEMLPFWGVSFVSCLHWDQFLALIGQGTEPARFAIRLKRPQLPAGYLLSLLGATTLFIALPYGEELWRCRQAQKRGLTGRDTPECARELFASA